MKSITIEATKREGKGTTSANQLRREGNVPFVIYGGDSTVHCHAPLSAFHDLIFSPSFVTATINVDGKQYNAIIKEMQFHPVTDRVLHIDFLELIPGKPILTEIPVQIEGRAKGVAAGGKLLTQVRKLKVKALPENLSEYITVDVTNLSLGKSIKIKDLRKGAEGIEIMHPDTVPVASVVTPRILRTAAEIAEEEEGEEGEETEATEGEEGVRAEGTADEQNA